MSATAVPAPPADPTDARRDALRERLNQALTGMVEVGAVALGERLGLYAALAASRAMTSAELADATRTHERYAREWLEQQTLAGMLEAENPQAGPAERRFRLPPRTR